MNGKQCAKLGRTWYEVEEAEYLKVQKVLDAAVAYVEATGSSEGNESSCFETLCQAVKEDGL